MWNKQSDADIVIVETAIEGFTVSVIAVIFIGIDTDLLVMFVAR